MNFSTTTVRLFGYSANSSLRFSNKDVDLCGHADVATFKIVFVFYSVYFSLEIGLKKLSGNS